MASLNPLPPLLLLDQFPVLSNQRPTIDASLGVGMVSGVKALHAVLLALGVGCGEGYFSITPATHCAEGLLVYRTGPCWSGTVFMCV